MPTINSLVKIKYEGRDCLAVMVRLAEYWRWNLGTHHWRRS
jgi:hypothetical protein